jgi:hypothetical protein
MRSGDDDGVRVIRSCGEPQAVAARHRDIDAARS